MANHAKTRNGNHLTVELLEGMCGLPSYSTWVHAGAVFSATQHAMQSPVFRVCMASLLTILSILYL